MIRKHYKINDTTFIDVVCDRKPDSMYVDIDVCLSTSPNEIHFNDLMEIDRTIAFLQEIKKSYETNRWEV